MNWQALKKLKRAMRRMSALLLATLTLTNSAFAMSGGGNAVTMTDNGFSLTLTDNGLAFDSDVSAWDLLKEQAKAMGQNPPEKSEAEIVAALQPGDSYISGDTMYVCHEEIYVDWKRVRSADDLDPSDWGNEERLLLMTDYTGYNLYLGNDYVNTYKELGGKSNQVALTAQIPGEVRRVVSGVTRDTSGDNVAEYVDKYVYPELFGFASEKLLSNPSEYPYPDTFRTVGTMNAPYIEYMGLDAENGNQRKFNIIMSKDDGTKSSIALSHDDSGDRIQLKAVSECTGFTFHMGSEGLKIFENIKGDDDLQLRISYQELYGKSFSSVEFMPGNEIALFVGKKTVGKRIEVTSLDLEDAEQNPEALENVYGGAIEFYHWEKITSSSQLPTGNDTYRALLVWDNKYFLQGDDFRAKEADSYSMAFFVNEDKKSNNVAPGNVAEVPEIDLGQSEFYTMGGLGTPYIRFSHRDSDNKNCPCYTFQLAGVDDQPSQKWLCDGGNKLDICQEGTGKGHNGGMAAGIVVGQEADAAPGKVKVFFNESGGFDTGFDWDGNVFFGDDDGTGWDFGQFTLYIGKPVVYPAVRQNYVVGEDQFVHISQNGAMFKNVAIVVEKGGVLSVESWFMNNGRIVVDGGTLIVQGASNPLGDEMADDTEDSVMMPFADIHPSVSGSLELINGGELIVLSDARAAFSNISATKGSSILNNGMLLVETITLQESTLENRKGMSMFVGYDFREMYSFRNSSVNKVIDGLTSRLNSATTCMTVGTKSSIFNDGSIRYSTKRSPNDDSVWTLGSGSYAEVRGKASRYMLVK